MLVVSLVLLFVATWGVLAVEAEVMRHLRRAGLDPRAIRSGAGRYLWSAEAPDHLRRRYMLSAACVPVASLGLAAAVWMSALPPERRLLGATVAIAVSIGVGLGLARKVAGVGLGGR